MELKQELIYWAKKLNDKGFITARSGNISKRIDEGKVLITSHDSYLGELAVEEVVVLDLAGNLIEGRKEPTSEKAMHLAIYNKFKDVKAVVHSHSPFTTAFFNYFSELDVFSFEAKFYLGKVPVVEQFTPTVIEVDPVISALEQNNVVVLKNHGVISIGKSFKEAFSLIELLEEQSRVGLITKNMSKVQDKQQVEKISGSKLEMLSQEHAQKLKDLVNNDSQAQELGKKYKLTTTLAVKDKQTNQAMCFHYQEGRIDKIEQNDNGEFVIIGDTDILKKVFNRQIDPFVALTQGKVSTKGDFTKLSKWYPVMVRTFSLWEKAPVR